MGSLLQSPRLVRDNVAGIISKLNRGLRLDASLGFR